MIYVVIADTVDGSCIVSETDTRSGANQLIKDFRDMPEVINRTIEIIEVKSVKH